MAICQLLHTQLMLKESQLEEFRLRVTRVEEDYKQALGWIRDAHATLLPDDPHVR